MSTYLLHVIISIFLSTKALNFDHKIIFTSNGDESFNLLNFVPPLRCSSLDLSFTSHACNSLPSLERGCCCFLPCQSCHIIPSLFVSFIMQVPVCLSVVFASNAGRVIKSKTRSIYTS